MTRHVLGSLALAALFAPLAFAQTPRSGGLAWSTPGPAPPQPAAAAAELHQTTNENGVMHMLPLPDGLALPAGQGVTLAPGGLHVMLMGLRHPLKQGETLALTLTFEHAAPVTVQVPVQAAGASSPAGHGGHAGMDMGR